MRRRQKGCWEENGFSFIPVRFERLLHIPDFVSPVHDCRLQVRLCMALDGVCIWKLGVICKKLMVDWVIAGYDVSQWSSVQNKQHRPQHWALWNTKHRGEEEEEAELLTTTHCAVSRIYDQKHWSAVEWMPKTVSRWERRIWWSTASKQLKDPERGTEILSSSIAFSKSLAVFRSFQSWTGEDWTISRLHSCLYKAGRPFQVDQFRCDPVAACTQGL